MGKTLGQQKTCREFSEFQTATSSCSTCTPQSLLSLQIVNTPDHALRRCCFKSDVSFHEWNLLILSRPISINPYIHCKFYKKAKRICGNLWCLQHEFFGHMAVGEVCRLAGPENLFWHLFSVYPSCVFPLPSVTNPSMLARSKDMGMLRGYGYKVLDTRAKCSDFLLPCSPHYVKVRKVRGINWAVYTVWTGQFTILNFCLHNLCFGKSLLIYDTGKCCWLLTNLLDLSKTFWQLFVPSICLLLLDLLCQYNKAAHTFFVGFQK